MKRKNLLAGLVFVSTILAGSLTTSCDLFNNQAQKEQELSDKKTSSISEIENYCKQEDYRTAEWVAIYNSVQQAKTQINQATSIAAIDNIVSSLKTNLDKYKTIVQYEAEELTGYIQTKIAEIENYKDLNKYRSVQKAEITLKVNCFKEDVVLLKTKNDVDTLVGQYKKKLDAIKSDAQLTYEESLDLSLYKTAAKSNLDSYVNVNDYSGTNYQTVTSLISEGKQNIEAAESRYDIDQIVSIYKTKIDLVDSSVVLTAKELADYKNIKKAEIDIFVDTENYRDAQILEINQIISAFKTNIEYKTTKYDVDILVNDTKTSLLTVKTAEESQGDQEIYPVSLYYDGYYNDLVSWTDAEDLKTQLHNIISAPYNSETGKGYRAISYVGNWDSNKEADQSLSDMSYINQVYNSNDILKEYSYSNTRTTGYQREHAFCASLMCGSLTGNAVETKGRATDFHNLFAAFGPGNGSRGNKCLGNVSDDGLEIRTPTDYAGQDYKHTTASFEPSDADKGKLARAIIYMTVMYTEDVYDENTKTTMKALSLVDGNVNYTDNSTKENGKYVTGNTAYTEYAHGNKQDILNWAKNPVTYAEYQHNQSVYSHISSVDGYAQGNRNPFVDYPDLVDYLYGSKTDVGGKLEDLKPSYVSLNLNKSGAKLLTLGTNTKHDYEVGDTFREANIELYARDKEFKLNKITDFDVSGIQEGETLTAEGTRNITITSGELSTTLTITVSKVDIFNSSNYKYLCSASDFNSSTTQDGVVRELTLNGVKWNCYYKLASGMLFKSGLFGNSSTFNMTCGNATKNCIKQMYFESASDFSYDESTTISSITVKAACASNKTVTISFYVDGTKYGSTTIDRPTGDSEPLKTATVTLPSNTKGKIKIVIDNNDTGAIYLYGIAVKTK